MNPLTLKALQASIAHWKRMIKQTTPNEEPFAENCPLCDRFGCPVCVLNGEMCPVHKSTGWRDCQGSPWGYAADVFLAWKLGLGTRAEWRVAAKAEVAFLESLVPKTHKKKVTP